MNQTTQSRKSIFLRIYEWPISYVVGLLIGLTVTSGFALWDSTLERFLLPAGIYLFLGGWILLIGFAFGNSMDKIIGTQVPTRRERLIRRSSLVLGICLNAVAWTFFAVSPEPKGEQVVGYDASRSGSLFLNSEL